MFLLKAEHLSFSVVAEAVFGLYFPIDGFTIEDVLDRFKVFNIGVYSLGINLPFTKYGKAMAARAFLLDIIEKVLPVFQTPLRSCFVHCPLQLSCSAKW